MLNKIIISTILVVLIFTMGSVKTFAQQDQRKYRMAKVEVYTADLKAYKEELALHAETAVKVEPGVLSLQAVQDKKRPDLFTVFEVYASEEAYQFHLKTPHFLKYKTGTLKMVKSLELVEVAPVALEIKQALVR